MPTASPVAPAPPSSTSLISPDACVSLASILRCYYSSSGSELHHILLIIPVALELIFSTSLIFTNWRSGKRHLLLVAEGLVYFLLALAEVLLLQIPAARDNIPAFKAIDQTIGALSFTQLFFYMAFLYAFVRSEFLPIIPSRIRRIIRPLLLTFIPTVLAMNAVSSFAGITYTLSSKPHVETDLNGDRGRFVWTFFSSVTLALFIGFQFSCFCFAFYRLVRALLTQRNIETNSKDAAVLFRGIGWINAGIKLGAIETTIGFVFYGIPIAYVRRVMRMFSRALLCIGVAKGMDQTEDFRAVRDELESNTSAKEFRRPSLRVLISNPRLSTFRQLSPTATAFHATPRVPRIASLNAGETTSGGRPHPYSAGGYLTREKSRDRLSAQTPVVNEKFDPLSPGLASSFTSPTITQGLPGMAEFARIKAQRMSQYSPKRVTVYYDHGTPTLHLRLSVLDLPTPAIIAQNLKNRPTSELADEYGKTQTWTPRSQVKERSRFSATSRGSSSEYSQEMDETITVYPASTIHGHTVESENVYRYGANPYGYLSTPSSRASDMAPTTTVAHGHSPMISHDLIPPVPGFINPAQRFSGYSEASSNNSAAQAEIVDKPQRKLSFTRHKSTLARAVLYPVPSSQVAMALSGTESITSFTPPRQLRNGNPSTPQLQVTYPSLPTSQRPSPSPSPTAIRQASVPRPIQPETRYSTVRESVIDDDGNVITVTAIASPDDDEAYDSPRRAARAVSGYSVRSVPETLQAVRELAMKFPGPPAGAVVANIGMRASTMTPTKERLVDEAGPSSHGHDRDDDLSRSTSSVTNGHRHGRGVSTAESTDTEELIRRRIPAQVKMKGKMVPEVPLVPLPPIPDRQPQKRQLPVIPPKNPRRTQQLQQLPPRIPPQARAQVQFNAKTIDPFDEDGDETASYRGAATDLSPLTMSVNLRHPQSFISTIYQPSTRRNSGATTALPSPTTPFILSEYTSGRAQRYSRSRSQDGQASPGVIDFGTALEWDTGDQKLEGSGHRRSLSAQTRAEFARLQQQQQRLGVPSVDLDVADELPDQLHELQQIPSTTGASLGRIKSIGNAPRRTTPQPTRGRYVRESMHLQHLVIPDASSGQDVPISAVDAGGVQTILGVDRAGMSVAIGREQEQDDIEAVLSATTEDGTSSNGRSLLRALSIEDGGYVPIKLQGSRRRRF
ncbi:hypothetical protein P691DRAFT_759907 [Macrolepiota fuliginosa MF-IS2]|uniref:Uncharacterized protein n=1 Tax=Macrolepiota fuliginosa MF-IS2 TaxID=1400762 RepID=A0A9P6C4P1_9AGAR|nr:hypothetical protein P691DRAFT_759907 [Macrolepiota fuliginosa MF-IS2]